MIFGYAPGDNTDISSMLSPSIYVAKRSDSIAAAACGPDSLMQTARSTVVDNIKVDCPGVYLHCEQFGW